MVCVVCGMRGSFYSLWRSIPAIFIHGNMPNHLQEDRIELPAKMNLDGSQVGFGQPHRAASFACVTQDAIFYDFVCVFFVFSSNSGLVLLEI